MSGFPRYDRKPSSAKTRVKRDVNRKDPTLFDFILFATLIVASGFFLVGTGYGFVEHIHFFHEVTSPVGLLLIAACVVFAVSCWSLGIASGSTHETMTRMERTKSYAKFNETNPGVTVGTKEESPASDTRPPWAGFEEPAVAILFETMAVTVLAVSFFH